MGKKQIYINNIPISNAFLVEATENIIVCNSLKEEFFGISTLNVEGKEILCEQLDSNTVKCSIRIDEDVYNDVLFNLIVDKKAKAKVAVNINFLNNPQVYVEKKEEEPLPLIEENKNTSSEENEIIFKELVNEIDERNNKIKQLEREINFLHKQSKEQNIIKEQLLNDYIEKNVNEGVEEYKQKLYQDFLIVSQEQKNIKEEIIKETIESLKNEFNEKYFETVSNLRNTTKEEIKKYAETFFSNIEKELFERQDVSVEELKGIIENTIKNDIFLVTDEVKNKVKVHVDENVEKLNEKLERYSNLIKTELIEIFENKNILLKDELVKNYIENIDKNNKDLTNQIGFQLEQLHKKIDSKVVEPISFDSNDLVAEATKKLIEEDTNTNKKLRKFKDQLIKDLQKAAENYATEANKRMMRYAEMMSGGGSTALQLANGGTIKGNLDVTGSILSGGKDLISLFSTMTGAGGTGREDVNTAVITNSANWNEAYDIATTYQSISSSFATNSTVNSVSSLLTPLTLTNTLTSQLVTNTTFNSYQTNVANATATLLPTSIYQNASGNWQSTYTTFNTNSSNWVTATSITSGLTSKQIVIPDNIFSKLQISTSTQSLTSPSPTPLTPSVTAQYTSTQTWTCPADVYSITIECWGGGGAGAAAQRSSTVGTMYGGGGGGGAYAKKNTYPTTPGQIYYINVGSGGTGSTTFPLTNGATSPGGDTWFSTTSLSANAVALAKGGQGAPDVYAPSGTVGALGAGGSSALSIGDVVYSGGNGSQGSTVTLYAGAGGGGAGSTGNGGNATTGVQTGGLGTSLYGGNGGIAGGTGQSSGSAGSIYGGGGGGARAAAIQQIGSNGAQGLLQLTYTVTPRVTSLSATSLIPAGSICYGVVAKVVSIGTSTYSQFNLGDDKGNQNSLYLYASGAPLVNNTITTSQDFNYTVPEFYKTQPIIYISGVGLSTQTFNNAIFNVTAYYLNIVKTL